MAESNVKPAVLVVHNDSREAFDLQALLEKNTECNTSSTWSGMEALQLLAAGHFDVLLMDDYVPDLYAGELIERAAALSVPPRILILGKTPVSEAMDRYQKLGLCTVVDRRRPEKLLQALGQAADLHIGNGHLSRPAGAGESSAQVIDPKHKN